MVRRIRAPLVWEIPKIKGSRFIAAAAPVADRAAAEAFVAGRREAHPQASHCCFAYRLGPDGGSFRISDDGEPSGTAGRPILEQIDGRGLSGIAVAVTRFFGGTKLGSGGLVRAYGGAAGAVLDAAETVETPVTLALRIRFPYALSGAVAGVLSAFGLRAADADYGESVAQTIAVPVEDAERLRRALADASAGGVHIERA